MLPVIPNHTLTLQLGTRQCLRHAFKLELLSARTLFVNHLILALSNFLQVCSRDNPLVSFSFFDGISEWGGGGVGICLPYVMLSSVDVNNTSLSIAIENPLSYRKTATLFHNFPF
jgi:hypothetical protein